MSKIGGGVKFSEQLLAELRDMNFRNNAESQIKKNDTGDKGRSFLEHLKDDVAEVNQMQKESDKMGTALATGKSENIHETMLAASQAELGFNLMVQVRNKVLEAYQEVMRMPV